MQEPLNVGLLGGGTVGGGVAKILSENPDRIIGRAGRPIIVKKVLVRNSSKIRPHIAASQIETDPYKVINDSDIQVIAELVGGTTDAKDFVLAALAAGKHVVTANKALLAEHGVEIFEAARKANRAIGFEASVCGGIPIINLLSQCLAANEITAIQGILNGTCNFILTTMSEEGRPYSGTLARAQALGYAEANPALDVDGSDAAHKLAVLAQIAFGVSVPFHEIERIGIDTLHPMDLKYAYDLGYTIKLLAEGWRDGNEVALHVAPVLLRKTDMLAQVRGVYNAVQVIGDAVGEMMFQGAGAGALPTASAVVSDLVDLAVGRAQKSFAVSKFWSSNPKKYTLRPSSKVRSRFYLRVLVRDEPGMLADVARTLANDRISIASIIQHEALEEHQGQVVPLVIMTHYAETGQFRHALSKINELPGVVPPGVSYSVDD